MPSPRSYLSFRRPGVGPFSNGQVALVAAALRELKQLRSTRNVYRVRRLISRLFSFHPQDYRIGSIINALSRNNVFSRRYIYHVHETLERFRAEVNHSLESDYSDDDL